MKKVSIRRQAMAVLLDYILFSTLCQVLLFTVDAWFLAIHVRLVFFIALEMLLMSRGISPGCFLMGIIGVPANEGGGYELQVDETIASAYPLMVLGGAVYVIVGIHFLIRWALWVPPIPLFGKVLREPASIVFDFNYGILLIYIGVAWLRLKRRAFWLSLILGFVSILSVWMSTPQWVDYMRSWLIQQRQYFGMSYDEISIALIKRIMPGFAYATAGIQVVWAILFRKRLNR